MLAYLAALVEAKLPHIHATDLGTASMMFANGGNMKADIVIAHPAIPGIVKFLSITEKSIFEGAKVYWMTAPAEEIELPELTGDKAQQIDTGLTPAEFCNLASFKKGNDNE